MTDSDRGKRPRHGLIGALALVVVVSMMAPALAGAGGSGTAPTALQDQTATDTPTNVTGTPEVQEEATARKARETSTTVEATDTPTNVTGTPEVQEQATPRKARENQTATATATPTANVTPAFDEDWRIESSLNESQMQNMSKSQLIERIQSLQRVLEVSEEQYLERIHRLQRMLDEQANATESNVTQPRNATGVANVSDFANATGQTNATATPSADNTSTNATNATVIRLNGRTPGWVGMAPQSINGTTNPTLNLTAGETYRIWWVNTDGEPHNVVIRNSQGESLVRSPIVAEQGATQNVTFTATENMSTYLCEVHPTSMVGDVSVSGNGSANASADNATAVRGPSD